MAYQITKRYNNGYRCCCHRTWDKSEWVESREQALLSVPKTYERDPDCDLENIEVVDGETGETIAEGHLTWHGKRGQRYSYSRWYGWVEEDKFEVILGGKEGESWGDIIARLDLENTEAELKAKEAELEKLKKETASLRDKLKK